MYQWKDPDSGTTQLSGKPPAWYRTGEGGPRIIVFDNGKIIDDTSIEISDVQRESLRQNALLQAEEDKQKAIKAIREAEEMKAEMNITNREQAPFLEEEKPEEPPADEQQSEEDKEKQEKLTEEKMRAVISGWEKQKTEDAKEKAESLLDDTSSE